MGNGTRSRLQKQRVRSKVKVLISFIHTGLLHLPGVDRWQHSIGQLANGKLCTGWLNGDSPSLPPHRLIGTDSLSNAVQGAGCLVEVIIWRSPMPASSGLRAGHEYWIEGKWKLYKLAPKSKREHSSYPLCSHCIRLLFFLSILPPPFCIWFNHATSIP